MDKIILFGNDGGEMNRVFLRAFSPFCRIECFCNDIYLGTYGIGEASLTIMDYSCPFFMKSTPAIFIFKKSALCYGGIKLPSDYIPILESDNVSAVRMLSKTGAAAVTCGMSPRDTLSLSSNDYPSALLSIQRDLRIPGGHVLEPADVLISLSEPTPEYSIMAACGALVLFGHISDGGYCI